MNAHADMLIVVSTQRIKHTQGHLPLSCFGYVKFSGFRSSKTSANKRLLNMSANRLLGLHRKGTTKFASVQIFKVKSEKCRV